MNDRGIGMALSSTWHQPFKRLNNGAAVLGPASPMKTAVDEDMTVWRSARGLHMILHQEGRAGMVGVRLVCCHSHHPPTPPPRVIPLALLRSLSAHCCVEVACFFTRR